MSVHSASGRGTVRRPKGPAKIIPLPTGRRRRRYGRTLAMGVAALGVAFAGAALVWLYILPLIQLTPSLTAGMSEQESEILGLVNDERRRAGEAPLRASQRLVVAARGHSYDMALRHYLAHNGPAGDTPDQRVGGVGVEYGKLAENLYLEHGADLKALPERALEQWLKSPEHRDNLLSPDFTSAGVGIAQGADGTAYVTQDFVN